MSTAPVVSTPERFVVHCFSCKGTYDAVAANCPALEKWLPLAASRR